MNFYAYWRGLNDNQKQDFAKKSGYSANYIQTHLIHKNKIPSVKKIEEMAKASNGRLSFHGLCDFFVSKKETP